MSVELPLLWKHLFKRVHSQMELLVNHQESFNLLFQQRLVEDTLNELLPLLSDGDIIIDHGNSNFKDSRQRAERLVNLASNILTAVLVVEFMVWSVDTVLWLVVQIQQYLYVPHFQGTRTRYWICLSHRSTQL